MPHRVRVHEMAHVLLGHTAENVTMTDSDRTPRDVRELEAEGVAMVVCDVLGLPGEEYSRGYIQHWNKLNAAGITEQSAKKIFKVADQILKAGTASVDAERAAS